MVNLDFDNDVLSEEILFTVLVNITIILYDFWSAEYILGNMLQ